MARQRENEGLERIPVLLNDILMRNSSLSHGDSSAHLFRDIIRNLSQPYCKNMPPLLLTAEDREQLQKDREKAIQCEELLAVRRQEKYFDLVDKIQGVLKRIEEKNCKTSIVCQQTNDDIPCSTSKRTSSDYNNNPSPKQPETFFEHKDTVKSVKPDHRRSNVGHTSLFPNWENSEGRNATRNKNNSGRYSLPANFESYHYVLHDGSTGSEPMIKYMSKPELNRPSSVFSAYPTQCTNNVHFPEPNTGYFTESQSLSSTWKCSESGSLPWTNSSSLLGSAHVSESNDSHSAITKQRELLALEQKRLEEQFSVVQGKLFAEFQQRQNKLLQMYKASSELQFGAEKSMQSILEGSFESDTEGTIVLNNSDKENFVLNYTDELPKSPFVLSPKKVTRVTLKSPLVSQVPQELTPASQVSQKSTPISQVSQKSVSVPQGSRKSSADVRSSVKSFSSEVSALEFYDIAHLGGQTHEKESMEKGKKKDIRDKRMEKRSANSSNFAKKENSSARDFDVSVVTSPKHFQLSSFESQTKEIKNTRKCKFSLVSALAKGFLTRLLFQTEKINGLVMTIKDAKNVLNELRSEANQSLTDRSFKERVRAQLLSAQIELCNIFLDPSAHARMQILEQNRRLLREKQVRNENKVLAKDISQSRPKLSSATIKKRLSRQEPWIYKHYRQEKRPKSEMKNTPSPSTASKAPSVERTTPKSVEKKETTKASSAVTMTTATVTSATSNSPVTPTINNTERSKTVKNRSAGKVTKPANKTVIAPNKKRRTWDSGVLKPIQGRISPTIPDKNKLSGDKKQSTLSAARKMGQKLANGHQTSGSRGTAGTSENLRVNNKTYKVDKTTRAGAKRSLAANLSNK